MSGAPAIADNALPSLVKEAAAVLSRATSAAEVLSAHDMAATIYDAAKRAARLAKAKRAHDELINATYRVQADSLEIESLAKSRLAKEYDAARPAGAEKGGRPKTVPDGNGFTAEEVGLTRKQVHEARQMRDAIEHDPGIVRRALDQMLAERVEPTRAALKRELPRANLRAAVGTDSATAAERGNNLYQTPPEAMRALLSLTRFSPRVWEPACGRGAISRMLEDAGYEVELSDLVDYGTADRFGEVQRVENFLSTAPRSDDPDRPDIVTNPPYGADLNAFVAHALRVHRPRRMVLLLNLNFLCGFDDPNRCFAMDECPPRTIYVFTRRLPMMHRDGWEGPEASSRMNTAWFSWELDEATGSYDADGHRDTAIVRIDWKTFEGAKPCGPLKAGEALARPKPAAPGIGLSWDQPDNPRGRILAKLGSVEVGAVFPDPDAKGCTWSFWLGTITGPHHKARSIDAAKAAITKLFAERTGLAVVK
ncbi:MAG: SAM-dependent methyltransferase [Mesorhizobium sp.]|nr:SAM-dependent methyltransferase [Mesorhizobium sp.]MBN9242450.1 SAM-dependent methyltransferase [Mesorhizobium sp.]